MPFATRSVMVNAPIESIWNALKDKAEHPEKYIPYKVEELKIHETFPNGLLREIKTAEMHMTERVNLDKANNTVTFTVENHPLYTGVMVNKIVPPEDPGALPILTFTMDLEPRSPESDKHPDAQWFHTAAEGDKILGAVSHVKELIEAGGKRYTDKPMSPNQRLIREMFLTGESMHVENFVKFYHDDARYQFSIFPVAYGPQGIIDASTAFLATVKYCVHHIKNLWEVDNETLVCEMMCDYIRKKDLKKFTLPCCDTIRIRNGKVASLDIYMDIRDVFAD
jgi:SnoaL-like protein/acetylaranotin biosynthesis cluster protein L